jgi:hypothetical protein
MTPSRRTLPLAALLGAALLAGPAAGSAGAATKHAPCPTTGKTLAKDVGPNLRVWRQGSTLKACSRVPGRARHLRTLGPWTSATKVATGSGTVAWTTRTTTDGVAADAVRALDVPTGKRWLSAPQAAVASSASTPASTDRVLRLVTDGVGTGWVTSRGIIGLGVRKVDADATDPLPAGAFLSGRTYFLGDAGPAEAADVAQGIELRVGGEHDDCGGTDVLSIGIPAYGSRPESAFVYAEQPVAPDPDIC